MARYQPVATHRQVHQITAGRQQQQPLGNPDQAWSVASPGQAFHDLAVEFSRLIHELVAGLVVLADLDELDHSADDVDIAGLEEPDGDLRVGHRSHLSGLDREMRVPLRNEGIGIGRNRRRVGRNR